MVTQQNSDSQLKEPQPEWVLLSYRIPREPSTPRIAVWRKLKDLGIAQISDGLVALPSDARTREHFEWIAVKVLEADGEAMVWIASTVTRRDDEALAQRMRQDRTVEYEAIVAEASQLDEPYDQRAVARLRRQWRKIDRRDYFRSPGRDDARLAIASVATNGSGVGKLSAQSPTASNEATT